MRPPLSVVLLSIVVAGCGGAAGEGRFAVEQRTFAWRHEAPSNPPPLTLEWNFDEDDGAWVGDAAVVEDGRLVLSGQRRVEITGPAEGSIDPDLHWGLVVELACTGVETMTVSWRREDEDFARSARVPLPVVANGESEVLRVPFRSLLGLVQAEATNEKGQEVLVKRADAVEGFSELRLAFRGPEDAELDVAIESIRITSIFDVDESGVGREARLGRNNIYRRGVILRSPGTISTELEPGRHDRLRFALALAGTEDAVRVHVEDADGRLPPQSFVVEPRADWLDVAVDLSPLAARKSRLLFRAEGTDSARDPRAVVLVGSVLRMAPGSKDLPPIVLYVEDTLRADRLGVYGYEIETDPHLQSIAAEGAVFEEVYASSNWTRPAITTLLTSLDPLVHGNRSHDRRISESVTTLAEFLAGKGYLTTTFVTNYHGGQWSGLDQGVDVAREPPAYGAATLESTLTSRTIAAPLAEELERHADERLFVFVHTLDPHQPYSPPPEDRQAVRVGRPALPTDTKARVVAARSLSYDAEIHHNDRLLLELDQELSELGMAEDTLFLFVSDHGEGFGEHGLFGHRSTLYQEELHVPMIVRWPKRIRAGTRVRIPTGHVDVASTLLGLLGFGAPDAWQGRDLSVLLRGGELSAREAEVPLFVDAIYANKGEGRGQRPMAAVVQGGFKLIAELDVEDRRVEPVELYDLTTDPGETVNLLERADHADRARVLAARLEHAVERASRSAGVAADGMDPETKAWMQAMGYIEIEDD